MTKADMHKHLKKLRMEHWIAIGAFAALAAGVGYLGYLDNEASERMDALTRDISALQSSLASTTETLQGNIAQSRNDLTSVLSQQQQSVGSLQSQLGTYQRQVGEVAGTVTTLQKLAKTDPELLKKYSKVFFLNENYAPSDLTQIPSTYTYSETKPVLIATPVWPYMKKMLDDVPGTMKIYVYSGHRSFTEQNNIKGAYTITYGAGTANTFSADQGYSEHQLGTTADFITTGLGGQLDGFDATPAYQWMVQNAYKYGFVLSYPPNNQFYIFEPWHWRFVGVKLATDLHSAGKYFYEWDQRKIDEYLVSLYD